MTRPLPVGEVRPFGDRALLIGVADPAASRALSAALARVCADGEAEVVGGRSTVCVLARDPDVELAPLRESVAEVVASSSTNVGAEDVMGAMRTLTVPCAFDGPDLAEVAALAGCRTEDVVTMLTEGPLTVGVVGFSPGFAYLDGLADPLRAVPRRARPRPAVPAGSVALANGHAAVYPTASPGGWQLVGRTGVPFFSLDRPPYALLAPGDRVQFTVAAAGEATAPAALALPAWSSPPAARPVFELVAPGVRAVVQDAGRRGVAGSGVPDAGPADRVSWVLANALVANDAGAAALELTGGGARLRALEVCHVAVVGAAPSARVDGIDVEPGQLVPLDVGQVLEVTKVRAGCRTYVAVAGGLLGPEVFDSRSSDELSGLGRGALHAGDRLFAGAWAPPLGDHLAPGAATALPAGDQPVELRVVAGPHAERFAPDVLERLAATVFRVRSDSNRVGIRLEAEAAETDWGAVPGELDSQPMVTGAVQLPPGGEPVALGPDHATLGGYPVPAVVIAADLGRLGQCGPGTPVRLVPVGLEEAGEAWHAQRRMLAAAVVGHYPLAAG